MILRPPLRANRYSPPRPRPAPTRRGSASMRPSHASRCCRPRPRAVALVASGCFESKPPARPSAAPITVGTGTTATVVNPAQGAATGTTSTSTGTTSTSTGTTSTSTGTTSTGGTSGGSTALAVTTSARRLHELPHLARRPRPPASSARPAAAVTRSRTRSATNKGNVGPDLDSVDRSGRATVAQADPATAAADARRSSLDGQTPRTSRRTCRRSPASSVHHDVLLTALALPPALDARGRARGRDRSRRHGPRPRPSTPSPRTVDGDRAPPRRRDRTA